MRIWLCLIEQVVKLHTKLGKPIPPPDPKASAAISALNAQEEAIKIKVNDVVAPSASGSIAAPPVRSLPPRINFVAGSLNMNIDSVGGMSTLS